MNVQSKVPIILLGGTQRCIGRSIEHHRRDPIVCVS